MFATIVARTATSLPTRVARPVDQSILDTCKEQGRGRAVHIRGEAGIGKTRLLEEFCLVAREEGFACHTGLVLNFGAGTGRDAIGALARDILGLTQNSGVEAMMVAVESAAKGGLIEGESRSARLGDAEYMRGHMMTAHRHFESCISLAHRHGLERIGAANRPMAAYTRWYAGETREALSDARAAIVAAKRIGHKRAEMIAHHAA